MRSYVVLVFTAVVVVGCAQLVVRDGDTMGSQVAKIATRVPLAVTTLGLSEVEIGCDSGRLPPEQCGHTVQTVVDGIGRSTSQKFAPPIGSP
jgi:hypothetical protein